MGGGSERGGVYPVQLAGLSCSDLQSPIGQEARRATALFVRRGIEVAVWREAEAKAILADLFDRENSLLNRQLVRQGLVETTEERFRADEQEARSARRGLWQNRQ